MTLLIKKNGTLFPTLVNDLIDSNRFFGKNLLDAGNDIFDLDLTSKVPSVNIIENTKDYKIELAAPGLEKKDFKIELSNEVLTVSSEKKEAKENIRENYKRREFFYRTFSRTFQLPDNLISDKIDARYENGILHISLPKKEVTVSKPKKEIKVS